MDTSANSSTKTSSTVGFYSAILTVVITILTFGFAMMAIPISGANCPADCIEYPYLDTISQFPRDYVWMLLAIVLMFVYLILMLAVHYAADEHKKIFSHIALCFAIISALILSADYFVQFSVVPISLMSAETEGITLLTQYNAHGVFIALEEFGYLVMSLSFLFIALVFGKGSRLETAIRWVFIGSFCLVMASLTVISIAYGLDRLDRFEVLVISINWLALIVNGILLSILFRRRLVGMGQSRSKAGAA